MNTRCAALLALLGLGCSSTPTAPVTVPADVAAVTDVPVATDVPATTDVPVATDASAIPDTAVADVSPAVAAIITARPYVSVVPETLPSTPMPLVILLHGYGASGSGQDIYFRLGRLVDARGFLLATPDGTVDASGRRFWNATNACCNFANVPVDDVAYVSAIIDDMSARYSVDTHRVFLVGHSNGGFMAHRYACDRSDRIAAIVSLAGSTWNDTTRCTPDHPVSVLQVHGTSDATIAYNGGMVVAGAPFPSAHASVARWAGYNHCDAMPTTLAMRLDLDTSLAGADTHIERHENCTAGAAELWTIENGAHIPGLGSSWAPAILDWLMAHAR